MDATLAAGGLALTMPLLAVIALAIRAGSPGPILFRQTRVGRGGVAFVLFKFRTMSAGGTGPGVTANGDPRITPIGRLLRRTKLDELPELWNVLAGDMALVGPRPEIPEFVDLDDPVWRATLAERPGLAHPVTLRLLDEAALLATAPQQAADYYRHTLLPYKLRGYESYRRRRSWYSDLAVLGTTVLAIVLPGHPPPPSSDEILG